MKEGADIAVSDFAARSWCSTSGARGAGRAGSRRRSWRRSTPNAGRGVEVLGIDVRDENRSAAAGLRPRHGLTYPSIYDPPGRSLLA